ncbi:hypothetical protein [Paraburkholderia sp. JHI869]|uniref:hypothetical protein n=1 Tax=Paraburkholderia sp. JHI869 TaxID=3112959 RepID=UPI00317A93AC
MSYHRLAERIERIERGLRIAAFGALLPVCIALPAWSADTGFMRDVRIEGLDPHDIEALDSTVRAVLNTRDDGEASQWTKSGPDGQATVNATLTPEGTSIKHQRTCRYVVVAVHAASRSVTLRPKYCRASDGTWSLQAPE